jgi:hypothetical protein
MPGDGTLARASLPGGRNQIAPDLIPVLKPPARLFGFILELRDHPVPPGHLDV